MQTTLLGLAIAFILALLAALVGPYFIDWNQFRPQFEAEASRVIGAPVRVGGQLDARLLPTPTLRLRTVAVGGAVDTSRLKADKLDVEFSLGALLRGEWRATDLTINGLDLAVALDPRGQLVSPLGSGGANLAAVAIDRLSLTGRAALHDAASGAIVALDDIAFSGDVRALAGAARGDGNFSYHGVRYPFRLVTGRSGDGGGTRVRFTIDPGERPFGIDLDGVVTVTREVPRFDGALTLSRAIALRSDSNGNRLQTPWKLGARVKADPAAAKFEQVELVYGSDDSGLKLAGSADARFGAAPALRAALSARQLDADRLLAKESAGTEPTRLIPGLRSLVAAIPAPSFATRLEIDADTVMLGGRPVQGAAAAFHGDSDGWIVDRLEARMPGGTQLALAGRLASGGDFKGDLKVDASDPEGLAAWLRGRGDSPLRLQGPLRLSGNLSVGADRIALERAVAEVEGAAVEGRFALSGGAAGKGAGGIKLEAALKAAQADLDVIAGFARAFAGPQAEWPDEAQLSLDIGHGRAGGQDISPLQLDMSYGPGALTLTSLRLGGSGGVTVEGSGAFDRTATTGKLGLKARAASLEALSAFLSPVLPPTIAARLAALPAAPAGARNDIKSDIKGDAKSDARSGARLKVALTLDRMDKADRAGAGRGDASANVLASFDLDAPQLKGTVRASAAPAIAALNRFDTEALARNDVDIDGKLTAEQGRVLLTLLGLERTIAVGDGAAQIEATATGALKAPLRFKAKLAGAELDADAQGSLEPWADEPKAAMTVSARKLDLSPLFELPPGRVPALTVALSSRLSVAGPRLSFDDIDSTVAGSRVRGRLSLTRGEQPAFAGELGVDTLDLGAVFGLAIGAAGGGADEPLGRGPLAGARGELGFQALRGTLPGGVELRPVSGRLKGNGVALTIDNLKGAIGGGDVAADLTAASGRNGLALDAHVQLAGVDGAALAYRGLSLPAGRASLQMALAARGRSAGALVGALSGNGTVSIDNARIGGLDPRVFDAAIAASDAGQAGNDRVLRDVVTGALRGAPLQVAALQIPFTIRDGSLRVTATTLDADGARAIVSGGYDIPADQADLRASLISTRVGTDTSRPEIQLFAHGAPDRLSWTVDVTSLSSWLAVRAIDRETRRLDAIERGEPMSPPPQQQPPQQVPAQQPAPPATAALPPAVEPVPGALPATGVPVPGRDPRRQEPKVRPATSTPAAAPRATPPQAAAVPPAAAPGVQPLPPPIEIRPAPGAVRHPKPAPRPPLQLAPPAQN
ncbi:AsmA family protein [Bradyrhizobium sp. 2TAF24]|uniref:AsmA family protein n=1 Tax=Bradyrhizobium sp. 2TAF24 TaxID=3233011 RepID=UPI003F90B9CA